MLRDKLNMKPVRRQDQLKKTIAGSVEEDQLEKLSARSAERADRPLGPTFLWLVEIL